jgi:sphinganine-1-phosphate aldolase
MVCLTSELCLTSSNSVHICVTRPHTLPGVADRFLKDLAECAAQVRSSPSEKATGAAAVYGSSQAIPDRSIVADVARSFIDALYEPTPAE